MNGLIRFIASIIVLQIAYGSVRGAFIGLITGIVAGVALGGLLWWLDLAGFLGVALILILGITGALLGSAIGAQLGVKLRPGSPEVSSRLLPGERIYVTDLNHALIPILGFLTLSAAFIILCYVAQRQSLDRIAVMITGGLLLALLIFAGLGSCYVIFWVELGEHIVLQRLLSRRRYAPMQIERWGFEVSRDELTQVLPNDIVPFVLILKNGVRFSTEVPPHKAALIARALYGIPGNSDHSSVSIM